MYSRLACNSLITLAFKDSHDTVSCHDMLGTLLTHPLLKLEITLQQQNLQTPDGDLVIPNLFRELEQRCLCRLVHHLYNHNGSFPILKQLTHSVQMWASSPWKKPSRQSHRVAESGGTPCGRASIQELDVGIREIYSESAPFMSSFTSISTPVPNFSSSTLMVRLHTSTRNLRKLFSP